MFIDILFEIGKYFGFTQNYRIASKMYNVSAVFYYFIMFNKYIILIRFLQKALELSHEHRVHVAKSVKVQSYFADSLRLDGTNRRQAL